MPTQIELRHNSINRRAAANMSLLWEHINSLTGVPSYAVKALNPAAAAYPSVSEFRWTGERGAWLNFSTGAAGQNVVDLIVWLSAGCSREAASDFLENLMNKVLN